MNGSNEGIHASNVFSRYPVNRRDSARDVVLFSGSRPLVSLIGKEGMHTTTIIIMIIGGTFVTLELYAMITS